MADYARRPPGVPAVIPSVFPGTGLVFADIPRAHTHTSTEIPPSIVHPRKDLFTALDLQPLYARYVKAPVNPSAYPRSFVSDVKSESRRGSNLADGSVPGTPGGKDGSSGGKKPPKPKLFSSVYEELLQEIPGESHPSGSRLIHLRLGFHAADPVPLPPNESLLDIPYHRYPNHLDDPNFQFSSLVASDRAKMALKLQVGHAQGVNGKVRPTLGRRDL